MFVEGDEGTTFVFSIPCDAVAEVEMVAVHAAPLKQFSYICARIRKLHMREKERQRELVPRRPNPTNAKNNVGTQGSELKTLAVNVFTLS